jgi:hypothetical protein
MSLSIILTLASGLLGGYYAYKTIASDGRPINGFPMLVMKFTIMFFFVSFIVVILNEGWKGLLFLPTFFILALISKNIFMAVLTDSEARK